MERVIPEGGEIAASIERELVLRNHNLRTLKMEVISGGDLQQLIGAFRPSEYNGASIDAPVTRYPSHFAEVLKLFHDYPLARKYGYTPEAVMKMPLDRYEVLRRFLKSRRDLQSEEIDKQLLDVVKALTIPTGGE
jgi:hypothetical protein